MGRTVKSSPISKSTVEKFLKWLAAFLHHSRFPHFPSVFQSVSLTLLCIVKILSRSDSYILRLSLLAGS